MKSANDPKADYKELVRRGYDRCAEDYNAGRQKEADYLGPLIDKLSPGAHVLDIGCGGGRPVCSELAKCFQVTGVDISPVQIELAKQSVPNAEFLCGDIMCREFPPSHFDAITSFYAIFHLPKEEHAELFARIHRWLRPGGYFMAKRAWRNGVGRNGVRNRFSHYPDCHLPPSLVRNAGRPGGVSAPGRERVGHRINARDHSALSGEPASVSDK